MQRRRHDILTCLVVFSLLAAIGCSKKTEEGEPADTSSAAPQVETQGGTQAETSESKESASEEQAAVKTMTLRNSAGAVDLQVPLSDIQAEAKAMDIEALKATALKYKEAILSHEDQIKAVSAKIKEIPMVEALGQEAKGLKVELQDLGSTLVLLKDRFQVYYDTLKEKGVDLSGLEQ